MDIHWNLFPNVANEHVLASLQGTVWASRELKQIMDSVLPPKKKKNRHERTPCIKDISKVSLTFAGCLIPCFYFDT